MLRNPWSIVLAAGDGSRLKGLALDPDGLDVPKQYCSLGTGCSLLQQTVQRAWAVSGFRHIVPVVAAKHRSWWRDQLIDLPANNLVVQPGNRGTAAGILLPLLQIAKRDAEAIVSVFPSDHYIAEEEVVIRAVEAAVEGVQRYPERIVLLGMKPDGADPEYSWIVPEVKMPSLPFRGVECFVDKPTGRFANIIYHRGGLWNSAIFVATVETLLKLYEMRLPELFAAFTRTQDEGPGISESSLENVYRKIPARDFSHDVLECSERFLGVVPVPPCGWVDLSTPEHLQSCCQDGQPATMTPLFLTTPSGDGSSMSV